MNRPAVPRMVRAITFLGLGLGTLWGSAWADSGTMGCPGTPSEPPIAPWPAPPEPEPAPAPSEPDGGLTDAPSVKLKELLPGTTRKTPGEPGDKRLEGPVLAKYDYPFKFVLEDKSVMSGSIHGELINEQMAKCGYHWVVKLNSTRHAVRRLIIDRFRHPVHGLYGDYRNDINPKGVPTRSVARTPDEGTTILFDFGRGLPGGQTSRVLLLATDIDRARINGTVRVEADDGTLSPAFPAWSPYFR